MASAGEDWQAKVARKQAALKAKIPKEWLLPESVTSLLKYPLEEHSNRLLELDIPRRSGILSDRELAITENYTVSELLAALRSGELTAVEVTTAFSKRASIAGQLTNCVTETYYDEALARAKLLDQARERGDPLGPLHGLPISLKDSFQITGSEATIGYVSYLDRLSTSNSPMVDVLLQQGAIYFVKTNVPMTMMTADSHNNIFGRTLNPNNTILTAGGSSGGEGALIAFRGAPLGVGTDVAGSVRIPALCNGTYGFKPTSSRVPYGGQSTPGDPGHTIFLACAGPLANDMDGLKVWTKAVIDAEPATYDVTTLSVPWRNVEAKTRLTIGVLEPDPVWPLQPPMQRALKEAVSRLEARGHTIVTLPASKTKISEAVSVSWTMFSYTTDGGARIRASGEPIIPSLAAGRALAPKLTEMSGPSAQTDESLNDYQRLARTNLRRFSVQNAWRELWNQHKLDVVIAAAAQHTAIPHDKYILPPYTVLLNCLDYPSCVIPFSKVSPQEDNQPFTIGSDQLCPEYALEATANVPCHIQVFGYRMRDEECLEAATVIDACLKN